MYRFIRTAFPGGSSHGNSKGFSDFVLGFRSRTARQPRRGCVTGGPYSREYWGTIHIPYFRCRQCIAHATHPPSSGLFCNILQCFTIDCTYKRRREGLPWISLNSTVVCPSSLVSCSRHLLSSTKRRCPARLRLPLHPATLWSVIFNGAMVWWFISSHPALLWHPKTLFKLYMFRLNHEVVLRYT